MSNHNKRMQQNSLECENRIKIRGNYSRSEPDTNETTAGILPSCRNLVKSKLKRNERGKLRA